MVGFPGDSNRTRGAAVAGVDVRSSVAPHVTYSPRALPAARCVDVTVWSCLFVMDAVVSR